MILHQFRHLMHAFIDVHVHVHQLSIQSLEENLFSISNHKPGILNQTYSHGTCRMLYFCIKPLSSLYNLKNYINMHNTSILYWSKNTKFCMYPVYPLNNLISFPGFWLVLWKSKTTIYFTMYSRNSYMDTSDKMQWQIFTSTTKGLLSYSNHVTNIRCR